MRFRQILFPVCLFAFVTLRVNAQTTLEYGIDFSGINCTLGGASGIYHCWQSNGAYIDSTGNISGQAIIAQGPLIATASGPYTGQPNNLLRFNGIAPVGSTTVSSFSGINAPSGVTGPAQTWIEIQDSGGNKYYIPAFSLGESGRKIR